MNTNKYEGLEQQGNDVYKALCGNGMTHEVATWLADLHIRVRECEISLLNHKLASDKELPFEPNP